MDTDKREHPATDAFLTNPVASPQDRTGYGVSLPLDEDEADSLSDLFEQVPTSPSRLGKSRVRRFGKGAPSKGK